MCLRFETPSFIKQGAAFYLFAFCQVRISQRHLILNTCWKCFNKKAFQQESLLKQLQMTCSSHKWWLGTGSVSVMAPPRKWIAQKQFTFLHVPSPLLWKGAGGCVSAPGNTGCWKSATQHNCTMLYVIQVVPESRMTFWFLFVCLFVFREKRREGEREGEKHWCERETSIGCFLHTLERGLNPKPRHVLWTGIKPVTFCFKGWLPSNWATQVRIAFLFYNSKVTLLTWEGCQT